MVIPNFSFSTPSLGLFGLNILPLVIPFLYSNRFHARSTIQRSDGGESDKGLARAPTQWKDVRTKLQREWVASNIGSGFFLFGSANILRIDGISSWEVTRTATLLSLLFALAGMLCGSANIVLLPSLQGTYETSFTDVRFPRRKYWHLWVLITLPFLHLSWAAIQFCSVIYRYSIPHAEDPEHKRSLTVILIGLPMLVCSLLAYHFAEASPFYLHDFEDREPTRSDDAIKVNPA
ncbi:hypothetical protein BDN72DRAFT_846850 [Pluteus cervinus]|uniref:Uncharacterized protein n=1 Tax=Pluteus cervinus TaxID=181527 RepID=A0ACD3AE47_9AGAR|nr:hypothetical protein BDN72DRAFT_846850 [Pluteus cervinus]